jgi:hypothetical protein
VNQQNKVTNGDDLRLQFVLPLDGGGRREMTATVCVTALDDAHQARFDAEIDNLLLQLIRQQSEEASSTCPTNTSA